MKTITGIFFGWIFGYFIWAFVEWDITWMTDINNWTSGSRAIFVWFLFVFGLMGYEMGELINKLRKKKHKQ